MTYVLQCPACGHDASEHGSAPDDECLPVDSKGHFCWITAASLYAAECERLDALLTRWTDVEDQRDEALTSLRQANHDCAQWRTLCDTRTAECERLMGLLQPMPQRIATLTTEKLHAESERDAARALAERYKAALDKIASWREGDTVTGAFDEPESAMIARTALAERYKAALEEIADPSFDFLDSAISIARTALDAEERTD